MTPAEQSARIDAVLNNYSFDGWHLFYPEVERPEDAGFTQPQLMPVDENACPPNKPQ
mgnify:CR=1 FL=1